MQFTKLDNNGRLLVKRLHGSDKWFAVTALNMNTRTVQVGGIARDYAGLVAFFGAEAAEEIKVHLVAAVNLLGDSE